LTRVSVPLENVEACKKLALDNGTVARNPHQAMQVDLVGHGLLALSIACRVASGWSSSHSSRALGAVLLVSLHCSK